MAEHDVNALQQSTARFEQIEEYRLDDQVGFILRLASQRHAVLFQKHTVLGLTPTQFATLIRISEVQCCSQNLLGRLTAMDVATIKGVVDRLRSKGLIGLKPDPSDKRRTLITLSEAGQALVSELTEIGQAVTQETLAPLNANERQTFLRLLRKLT